jgi:hypothetical protein
MTCKLLLYGFIWGIMTRKTLAHGQLQIQFFSEYFPFLVGLICGGRACGGRGLTVLVCAMQNTKFCLVLLFICLSLIKVDLLRVCDYTRWSCHSLGGSRLRSIVSKRVPVYEKPVLKCLGVCRGARLWGGFGVPLLQI